MVERTRSYLGRTQNIYILHICQSCRLAVCSESQHTHTSKGMVFYSAFGSSQAAHVVFCGMVDMARNLLGANNHICIVCFV